MPALAETAELVTLRPRLRSGLRFSLPGGNWAVIEDPATGKFHRVGPAEWAFLSRLDGTATVGEALAATAGPLGADALTESDAAVVCRWLVGAGLAETDAPGRTARVLAEHGRRTAAAAAGALNPVMVTTPLGDPRPLVRILAPFLSWLFTPAGFAVWAVWVAVGAYHLAAGLREFRLFTPDVVSASGVIWLAAAWLVSRVLHEAGHAVACRRFGVPVGRAGVLWLLFAPLPYVDVTASWRLDSRWHRAAIASAGVAVELLLAAGAAVVWSHAGPGELGHHARNVVLAAGLGTLLFNANPLMRFDGYHVLSDLTDLPNLAGRANGWLGGWVKRVFHGTPAPTPPPRGWRGWLVRLYAPAAAAWRVVICVSLALAAAGLFAGAGVVLAAAGVALWLGRPSWRAAKFFAVGGNGTPPNRLRAVGVAAGCVALAAAAGLGLPGSERLRLPAVVVHRDPAAVRPAAAGFVREVRVWADEPVDAGRVLFVLENRELARSRDELRLEVAASELRERTQRRAGRAAAAQVERRNRGASEARSAEVDRLLAALTVRAPRAGVVLADDLDALRGAWVTPGQLLAEVADPSAKELVAAAPPADLPAVRALARGVGEAIHVGEEMRVGEAVRVDEETRTVRVRVAGTGRATAGVVREVAPRAVRTPPHPALSATHGGPLAVRAVSPGEANPSPEAGGVLLGAVAPVRVTLPPGEAARLRAGQPATVEVTADRGTLAGRVSLAADRWWTRAAAGVRDAVRR